MSTTIRVKILPGGVTAKEVNRVRKPNPKIKFHPMKDPIQLEWNYFRKFWKWEKAESKLRTFEIENTRLLLCNPPKPFYEEGKEYSAEVLNDKTIKIIL